MEDDIPPANPNTITQTDDEHSNACNTDPATGRIEGKFVSENVFNLSSRNITEAEIKVFKKGLGFVPTPEKINRWQLKNDLEKFGRNVRLRMHFANEVTPNFSESPSFRIPSNWTPYINDVYLEVYLSEIKDELMKINEHGMNYSNLRKEERDALHNLSHDDSIIIKPADKGTGIVIWDRSDYLLECQRQLSEQQVYEKIEQNPLEKVKNRIKTTLKQMVRKKEIETKVMEYLIVKRPQLGRFYLLPKIHKRKTSVPGRPVISNNQTATENISSFLDFHLKNIVPTIPHIFRRH